MHIMPRPVGQDSPSCDAGPIAVLLYRHPCVCPSGVAAGLPGNISLRGATPTAQRHWSRRVKD